MKGGGVKFLLTFRISNVKFIYCIHFVLASLKLLPSHPLPLKNVNDNLYSLYNITQTFSVLIMLAFNKKKFVRHVAKLHVFFSCFFSIYDVQPIFFCGLSLGISTRHILGHFWYMFSIHYLESQKHIMSVSNANCCRSWYMYIYIQCVKCSSNLLTLHFPFKYTYIWFVFYFVWWFFVAIAINWGLKRAVKILWNWN